MTLSYLPPLNGQLVIETPLGLLFQQFGVWPLLLVQRELIKNIMLNLGPIIDIFKIFSLRIQFYVLQ